MLNYRRWRVEGGEYFLTVVTHERRRFVTHDRSRRFLREAICNARALRPFQIEAMVLLPDHFHVLLTLPDGEDDFSWRIGSIKHSYTKARLAAGGPEDPNFLGDEPEFE